MRSIYRRSLTRIESYTEAPRVTNTFLIVISYVRFGAKKIRSIRTHLLNLDLKTCAADIDVIDELFGNVLFKLFNLVTLRDFQ